MDGLDPAEEPPELGLEDGGDLDVDALIGHLDDEGPVADDLDDLDDLEDELPP